MPNPTQNQEALKNSPRTIEQIEQQFSKEVLSDDEHNPKEVPPGTGFAFKDLEGIKVETALGTHSPVLLAKKSEDGVEIMVSDIFGDVENLAEHARKNHPDIRAKRFSLKPGEKIQLKYGRDGEQRNVDKPEILIPNYEPNSDQLKYATQLATPENTQDIGELDGKIEIECTQEGKMNVRIARSPRGKNRQLGIRRFVHEDNAENKPENITYDELMDVPQTLAPKDYERLGILGDLDRPVESIMIDGNTELIAPGLEIPISKRPEREAIPLDMNTEFFLALDAKDEVEKSYIGIAKETIRDLTELGRLLKNRDQAKQAHEEPSQYSKTRIIILEGKLNKTAIDLFGKTLDTQGRGIEPLIFRDILNRFVEDTGANVYNKETEYEEKVIGEQKEALKNKNHILRKSGLFRHLRDDETFEEYGERMKKAQNDRVYQRIDQYRKNKEAQLKEEFAN